jgi:hypothetical protein
VDCVKCGNPMTGGRVVLRDTGVLLDAVLNLAVGGGGGGAGVNLRFEWPPEEGAPRTLVPVWREDVILRRGQTKYAWHCPRCRITLMTDSDTP